MTTYDIDNLAVTINNELDQNIASEQAKRDSALKKWRTKYPKETDFCRAVGIRLHQAKGEIMHDVWRELCMRLAPVYGITLPDDNRFLGCVFRGDKRFQAIRTVPTRIKSSHVRGVKVWDYQRPTQ